ncbi:hypothetical protein FEK35_27300 [Nocardia cyriacigeorgica]|uniref:Uncharacterized protein n=1 Tax=Nocardia cyriacigeorgica TaxID=135487 RepID=A0A5R8P6H1_9NOCA|nr:hypothetical protein [Nocardia cyriacigeorgica]MBF6515272.1 hypothetical protein [Nocardia cyriacigeorgica]TLF96801.1 hypothetical protein FEK35_27300 [Nocardia cyriacigeorgica]
MAVGISVANVSHPTLNWLRGISPPPVPGLYVKLHTGDPGAAGAGAASAVTARMQATMAAASGGQIALLSMSGPWTMTATETITHISVWDAASGGNFLFSGVLTTPRPVANGDTLTLITLVVAHAPLAA